MNLLKFSSQAQRILSIFGALMLLTACTATTSLPPKPGSMATVSPALSAPDASTPVASDTFPTETVPAAPSQTFLDIPYTQESPATDVEEILTILDALRQHQESWFARPGWYLKTECSPETPETVEWMDCMSYLVHVVDETRTCREQLVYFVINNQPQPFQIMLENGARAGLNVPDGTFSDVGVNQPDPTVSCSLETLESVEVWGASLLTNERASLEEFMEELNTGGGSLEQGSGGIEGGLRAWQETINGANMLILAYDITAYRAPNPIALDPQTGQNWMVERSTRLKIFDPLTGLQFQEQDMLYLQNGQVIGDDEYIGTITYTYYETLPPDLAKVFAETAAKVLARLDQ